VDRLSGRVALVTGAARGIGAATVRGLDAAGWSVCAVDRAGDDPRLGYPMATQASLDEVCATARDALPVVADVSDPRAVAAAVAGAEQRYGGLDAVVCCAGVIAGGAPAWELDVDAERALLEVNLGGVLHCARFGVPALLRRPEPRTGRFVAVASAAAVRGLPRLAAYCASKAGVVGLVKALAVELRGTGVTANAVAPGSTDTPMLAESARLYGLESADAFAAQQPIERLLTPDEVAAMLVWLAGEQAGGVTGALIPVDGGLTV
jgi:SDR family mycofactocin-dependent oxidoreductase